eukprot:2404914-Amphidinium_carterae.1
MSSFIHVSTRRAVENFHDKLRRQTYVTPTSYLELIRLFIDLLSVKQADLKTKLDRYMIGGQRLQETKATVDVLKVDLTKLQPTIEQGKVETAELIVQVDQEEAQAKEKQKDCAVDEKEAGEAAEVANGIKEECQKELDE